MVSNLKLDVIEDKVRQLELRLEQLKLSEVIVKGEKILELYELLKTYGIIDILFVLEQINDLKRRMSKIEEQPLEWLKNNEAFKREITIMVNKKIFEEVRNIGLLHLYKDDPTQLIKTVKETVKDYLKIWELNDKIAQQLVEKVIVNKMYETLLAAIIEDAKRLVDSKIEEKRSKLEEIEQEVKEIEI